MKTILAALILAALTACGGGGDDPNEEIDAQAEAAHIAEGKTGTGKPDCTKPGNCN